MDCINTVGAVLRALDAGIGTALLLAPVTLAAAVYATRAYILWRHRSAIEAWERIARIRAAVSLTPLHASRIERAQRYVKELIK